MALNLLMADDGAELKPRITVFGVGGAGGNGGHGGFFVGDGGRGLAQTGNGQDVTVRQRGEGNISVVVQSGYN